MGEQAQAEIADRVGHTRGPWSIGRSHGRGVLCVTADDACTWICGELLNEHEPIKGTEAEANAKLIAAAPDMLAALLAWRKMDAFNQLDRRGYEAACEEAYRLRVAAIAKAEGR